jgi:hypothetical protein
MIVSLHILLLSEFYHAARYEEWVPLELPTGFGGRNRCPSVIYRFRIMIDIQLGFIHFQSFIVHSKLL